MKESDLELEVDGALDSADAEKAKALEGEARGVFADGLRVVGIAKTYRRLPFGLKSKSDVHAVKGVYLDVPQNELLCLLGHNGAGKSTLFNMCTGLVGPTDGYAKIHGLDIRKN